MHKSARFLKVGRDTAENCNHSVSFFYVGKDSPVWIKTHQGTDVELNFNPESFIFFRWNPQSLLLCVMGRRPKCVHSAQVVLFSGWQNSIGNRINLGIQAKTLVNSLNLHHFLLNTHWWHYSPLYYLNCITNSFSIFCILNLLSKNLYCYSSATQDFVSYSLLPSPRFAK